jgi:predicted membrane channel-forming protein YqfA (hemolysin III family)
MLYLFASLGILYLVATTTHTFYSKSVLDGYAIAVAVIATFVAAVLLFCLCEPVWQVIKWLTTRRCFQHWRTQ